MNKHDQVRHSSTAFQTNSRKQNSHYPTQQYIIKIPFSNSTKPTDSTPTPPASLQNSSLTNRNFFSLYKYSSVACLLPWFYWNLRKSVRSIWVSLPTLHSRSWPNDRDIVWKFSLLRLSDIFRCWVEKVLSVDTIIFCVKKVLELKGRTPHSWLWPSFSLTWGPLPLVLFQQASWSSIQPANVTRHDV